MDWFYKAEQQIEDDYEAGFISTEEYHEEMRSLRAEYEQAAQDAAAETYNSFY